MSLQRTTVAVDLGKTRCRVAVHRDAERVTETGEGAPGLATADGITAAADAILPLLPARADRIGIGAAGAWNAPAAAAELARRLAGATGARVVVASDVVTAHIGALGGNHGVLLIAGTGAAALGVDDDGVRLVDGWGPELGDFGSGSWLGREGIRAALRATAGLGAQTALVDAVQACVGSGDIPRWLAADPQTARRLAAIAPIVLDAAEAGDVVAARIAAEAVRLLTASAVAAGTTDVALHGGLTGHPWFREALESTLHSARRHTVPAAGDALDGASLLVQRHDLPHERFVHRAG